MAAGVATAARAVAAAPAVTAAAPSIAQANNGGDRAGGDGGQGDIGFDGGRGGDGGPGGGGGAGGDGSGTFNRPSQQRRRRVGRKTANPLSLDSRIHATLPSKSPLERHVCLAPNWVPWHSRVHPNRVGRKTANPLSLDSRIHATLPSKSPLERHVCLAPGRIRHPACGIEIGGHGFEAGEDIRPRQPTPVGIRGTSHHPWCPAGRVAYAIRLAGSR